MKTPETNSPYRILLVDDDQHLLQSMGAWLDEQGFHTMQATNREAAEKHLASSHVDLALVDLRLGNEDGFEVLHHCKKHYPQVSVLLMTGYATVDTGVEAVRGCV